MRTCILLGPEFYPAKLLCIEITVPTISATAMVPSCNPCLNYYAVALTFNKTSCTLPLPWLPPATPASYVMPCPTSFNPCRAVPASCNPCLCRGCLMQPPASSILPCPPPSTLAPAVPASCHPYLCLGCLQQPLPPVFCRARLLQPLPLPWLTPATPASSK